MPYQLYFAKREPASFQLFNGDIPTLDMLGDEAELLLFEGDDVFLRIPISYQCSEDYPLGYWSTKKGLEFPQRIYNQKRSKNEKVEIPILYFFSGPLRGLAQREFITLQDLLEASINLLFVVEESNYPQTGYYHFYVKKLEGNEAGDWMGVLPDPTPENIGPYVPVHFLDGVTEKVAIIDTERIGDVDEELWGVFKTPHIHVEQRDYP